MAAARFLDVNLMARDDRELFQSLQKCAALFIATVYGALQAVSGMYGPAQELGPAVIALIIA